MSNLKVNQIQELSEKFNNVEEVKKELKKVQSQKCRLLKQKAKETYQTEFDQITSYEQMLKEVRQLFEPKKVTVTTMSWEQIQDLNYDETIKAIKSIQSKKCNSQYMTADPAENVEYQEALRIEEMLKKHKENIKPVEETVVKKSDLNDLIAHLEQQQDNLSPEYMIELLKKQMNK